MKFATSQRCACATFINAQLTLAKNEEECRRFLRSYGSHPAECINAIVVHNTGTKQTFEGMLSVHI